MHHTRKGESWNKSSKVDASIEDARGSGVLAGEVDNVIAVRGVPPSQRRAGEVRLVVENPDTRMGAPFEKRTAVIDLSIDGTGMTWTDAEPDERESVDQLLERALPVVPITPAAVSRDKLRAALHVKPERLRQAANLGLGRGVLIEGRKGLSRPAQTDPDPDPED